MLTLHESICRTCFRIAQQERRLILRLEGGAPSTTFTLGVFALPHLTRELRIAGFNTAFRPTDIDAGTHLPAFGQFYFASNHHQQDPESSVHQAKKLVLQILTESAAEIGIEIRDVAISVSSYNWEADSSGYRGLAYEINLTGATIDGVPVHLGELEIAQANYFSQSGLVQGIQSELIVIGIDRLITAIGLLEHVNQNRSFVFPTHFELSSSLYPQKAFLPYIRPHYTSDAIFRCIDDLLSDPADPGEVFSQLETQAAVPGRNIYIRTYHDRIKELADWSKRLEVAYISGKIAGETRKYLIHKIRFQFAELASDLADAPDTIYNQIFSHRSSLVELPGIHRLAEFYHPPLSRLPAYKTSDIARESPAGPLSAGSGPPTAIITGSMRRFTQSLIHSRNAESTNPILINGAPLWSRFAEAKQRASTLELPAAVEQRALAAVEAAFEAESAVSVRINPSDFMNVAAKLDGAVPLLSPYCYDICDLKSVETLSQPAELATVLILALDYALRSLSRYDSIPSGSRSDYLGVRQARNIASRAAHRLGLEKSKLEAAIEMQSIGLQATPIPFLSQFFTKRMETESKISNIVSS